MAYINVDYSRLYAAADEIDSYISLCKKKMASAASEVASLSEGWQGDDYAAFREQWEKATGSESVYHQMIKALESYSGFLRYAAEKYKAAQSKAVNSANSIPRY